MKQTSKSLAERRLSMAQTPISMTSITSKLFQRQERNVKDIYLQVKQKINEMQSAFKTENLTKQRQMLKTYVKVLDKIGEQVMKAKYKYKNLDKQNLKTDKRLIIVTQLNKQRSECNKLTKNIDKIRQQIERYEDENNYLEKQVEALQTIQQRKRSLSKSQHLKYKIDKKQSKSLQKKWPKEFNENDPFVFSSKGSTQLQKTFKTFDKNHREKSFIINSFDRQVNKQNSQLKAEQRPFTEEKHIGNKRIKNKFFNTPLQENSQIY